MIETGCFRELNTFGPEGSRPPDLDWSQAPDSPKRSLLDRIFRRRVRTLSSVTLVLTIIIQVEVLIQLLRVSE